tara:strand:+ start:1067 stop:1360 length:294 start_codon:yes stop_codon:yes gene_type:complete
MKIILGIFLISVLSGCVQNTAFFGPAVTVASTGSIYQAGLSYASTKTIIKFTGKTPTENLKFFLDNNKEDDIENANNFFEMVKKINKSSGVKNLTNQ